MMIKDRVPQKGFMGEIISGKSTVLLVCIKTEFPQEITIEYLLGKFDSFGKINKILIFERAKIIKAFVEFATPTSAQEALVGSSVLRDFRHRIKCYPSNHEGIQLTNDNNICAKDFTGKKGDLPQLTIFKDGLMPTTNLNPTSSHTMSTSDSPLETQNTSSHACEQVKRLGERDAADEELERTLKFLESNESLMAKNTHSSLRSRAAELDEANSFFEQQISMEKAKSFEIVDDDKGLNPLVGGGPGYRCFYPSNSLPTNLAFEEKQSTVLTISGLNTATTSINNIYNLFSNFGNIFTILYFRGDNSALVEFDTEMSSGVSKMLLNNIVLFGSQIKINYTNSDTLKQKLANFNPTPDELFIGNPKTHRFRGDRPLSINPPSDTLHVSNLVREACSEGLVALFAPFGNIEAFKFMHEEPIKHMCLIRFSSTKSAIDALAALHNCTLLRRNVQISFTRSKI